MSNSDEKEIEQAIEQQANWLAMEYVRVERQAFYGDLKSIDKLKRMRKDLDSAYQKLLENWETPS